MAKTVYAYTILLLLLAAPLSGCIGSGDSDKVTTDDIEDRVFLSATYQEAWLMPQVNITPTFIEDVWVISSMLVRHDGSIYTHYPSWGEGDSPASEEECSEAYEGGNHMEGYWFEGICFMGFKEPTMRTYDITDTTYSFSRWCLDGANYSEGCAWGSGYQTYFYDLRHRNHPIYATFQGENYWIQSLIQATFVDLVTPYSPDRCSSTDDTNDPLGCYGPSNPSGQCHILLEVVASPEVIFSAASVVLPVPHGASLPDGPWEDTTAFVAQVAASVPPCDDFYL